MGRLAALALAADLMATLSYSTGAHIVVRFMNPGLGAWWNGHEFAVMQTAAAVFGLLTGIRLAAGLVTDGALKSRSIVGAMLAAALVAGPAAWAGARIARFHFGSGDRTRALLIDRLGYGTGKFLDKLLAGGVYSFKMSAFAFPVGMILFGLGVAVLMTTSAQASPVQATSK